MSSSTSSPTFSSSSTSPSSTIKCFPLHQPTTLKYFALLEYAKKYLAPGGSFQIDKTCDLPPSLISDLYSIIVEELDKSLFHLARLKNRCEPDSDLGFYLSPIFPKSLVDLLESKVEREKKDLGVRHGWIKWEYAEDIKTFLFHLMYKFKAFMKYFEERRKWRVPLVYPKYPVFSYITMLEEWTTFVHQEEIFKLCQRIGEVLIVTV